MEKIRRIDMIVKIECNMRMDTGELQGPTNLLITPLYSMMDDNWNRASQSGRGPKSRYSRGIF